MAQAVHSHVVINAARPPLRVVSGQDLSGVPEAVTNP
jgi:hypothetical protein